MTNPGIGEELGTAILMKEGIIMEQIVKLANSRGIAGTVNNTRIINIYAPSGNNNRRSRAEFFKSGIVPLFGTHHEHIILAGDFNCVLHPKDQTPNFNKSVELDCIVREFQLTDTWEHTHGAAPGFTYITSHSASRLDRIYVSDTLKNQVLHSEVWPTIFSDHAAFISTINMEKQRTYRARGIWKLNTTHLHDEECRMAFNNIWAECEQRFSSYNSAISWWLQCAKPKLRKMLMNYSRQKYFWHKQTSEFYFNCLRELYTLDTRVIYNYTRIQRIKAKILKLQRQQSEGFKIRARTQDVIEGEETSIYHVMREKKRGKRKILTELKLQDGTILTKQNDIRSAIHKHFSDIMSNQPTDDNAWRELTVNVHGRLGEDEIDSLTAEIDEDELKEAVQLGAKNKSPGPDGIPIEFYQVFWPQMKHKMLHMYNEMLYGNVPIPKDFCTGIVVLIPKHPTSKNIENLRPITLLNSDYKIMARVLARRLRMVTNSIIGPYQTCVGKNKNIHQNIYEYRDVISTAEVCQIKCALVSLDFQKAFDRVNHQYLLKTMEVMGFPPRLMHIMQQVLSNSKAKIMVNGQLSPEIDIKTSVRQGCPMSMALFAIALEPFLATLTQELQGLCIRGQKIVCNAYADDVGFLVTSENEVLQALRIVNKYELASGAKLNSRKSSIMNLGKGIQMNNQQQLTEVSQMKCLGIEFRSNIRRTIAINYRKLLTSIRAAVQANGLRQLDEIQKTKLVNIYVTSKLNYVAQALPIPQEMAKRIMSALGHFVTQGNIFKVKYDTLTLPTSNGGLNLTDVNYKLRALYVCRMYKQWKQSTNSLTTHLLNEITPDSLHPPVNVQHIPDGLHHLKNFIVEYSYISLKIPEQKMTKVKDVYTALIETKARNIIESKYQNHDWPAIWKNIHDRNLPSKVRATWYKAVNRKVTTNSKLHAIHLTNSPMCAVCNLNDTEEHRFVCNNVQDIWNLVRHKLAIINRTSPNTFTVADFLTPDAVPFPTTKRNAVNWLKGHTVYYLLTEGHKNKVDYWVYMMTQHHFLKRTKNYRQNYAYFLDRIMM